MNPAIHAKNIVQDLSHLARVVAFSLNRLLRHKSRWIPDPTVIMDVPFLHEDLRGFIETTANVEPTLLGGRPAQIEENAQILSALASCLSDLNWAAASSPPGHEMFAEQLTLALTQIDNNISTSKEGDAFYVSLKTSQ